MKTYLPFWPRPRIAVGALSACPGLRGFTLMGARKPPPAAASSTRLEGTKDLKITNLPGPNGPVVDISRSFVSASAAYADVADNTTFDLTKYFLLSRPDHPTRAAFSAGEQPVPPKKPRITGGHRVVMTDSVFTVDLERPKKWEPPNSPKGAMFRGRNHLLWFGKPGTYGAKIPPGLTFIEGPEARKLWHRSRNTWLEAHGYEPRNLDDWNPMEAPVTAPRMTVAPLAR